MEGRKESVNHVDPGKKKEKKKRARMNFIGSIAISLLIIDFYTKARCSSQHYKCNVNFMEKN